MRAEPQPPEIAGHWFGLPNSERLCSVEFLKELRTTLRANAVVLLAAARKEKYPRLLEWAIQRGCESILAELRRWPCASLREALELGSRAGQRPPIQSALLKFPSERFPALPHRGVRDVAISACPTPEGDPLILYQHYVAIVNAASRDLNESPCQRNAHELLARQLICGVYQGAELRLRDINEQLTRLRAPASPSVVTYLLLEKMHASRNCGRQIRDDTVRTLVSAVIAEFSEAVDRHLGILAYETTSLPEAIARLSQLAEWTERWDWLELLVSSNASKALRQFAAVALALVRICRDEPHAEPIVLPRLIQKTTTTITASDLHLALKRHLKERFREQALDANVVESTSSHVRLLADDESAPFTFSMPRTAIRKTPRYGDQYRLITWDLWRYWYGITSVQRRQSTEVTWSDGRRSKQRKALEKIRRKSEKGEGRRKRQQ